MKKIKFIRILKTYIIGWLLAEIIFEILRNTDLRREEIVLIKQSILFFLTWIFQGVFFGVLHYYVDFFYRKKITYGNLLLLTLFAQAITFFIIIVLISPFLHLMGFSDSIIEILSYPLIKIKILYAFCTNFVISIMLEVNLILGKNMLKRIVQGKFYKPFQDYRIFMFLDLKDSTTHAEKLGHIKYSRLIQDCFYDLGVIDVYKAEVYKYVGDEVILVWNIEDGIQNDNCIKAFFCFDNELITKKEYYINEYGFLPEFKAGVYKGEVTIAEVGELKREIAYLGDTVNTTARIEGQCNKFKAKLLLSESLLKELTLEKDFVTEFKGNIILKGKEEGINLFSVKKVLIEE